MNETEIRHILAEHDGTAGYARQMCPRCEKVHPCQTYQLAQLALHGHRQAVTGE